LARRRGFTLLELLMVVGLLAVLALAAWPDLTGTTRAERLKESAKRMEALVAMCRAEAMNDARAYQLVFRQDGSVRVKAQLDPLKAPHLYNPVQAGWGRIEVLQENVWVAAVQLLPEGPAPIRIIDEKLVFPDEQEIEPQPIDEFEQAPTIEFEPDGTCGSLRWVLRDEHEQNLLLTLDGRLGRVGVEDYSNPALDGLRRPKPLTEEQEKADEKEYKVEDFDNS
jgi:prepilin-type N-terminal cleavage/methylation domain-containing protein